MAKKKKRPFPLWWLIVAGISALIIILLILLLPGSSNSIEETEPTTEPISRNEYEPENFYREDGFLRYRDGEHLLGIDVSAHQGVIDWEKVCTAEIDFAIIRIGYRGSTVGDLYEDEQFRYNLAQAAKHGLKVGVYFFSQALTPEEAVEEARFVCGLLEEESLELPIYFDWEYIGGRAESLDSVPLTECAVAFCEEVKAQGYQPGVYFNQEFGYYYLDMKQLQDYHLWLAEYNETPTFLYHFDCLQFTDEGTLDGIETTVDLNVLFLPSSEEG